MRGLMFAGVNPVSFEPGLPFGVSIMPYWPLTQSACRDRVEMARFYTNKNILELVVAEQTMPVSSLFHSTAIFVDRRKAIRLENGKEHPMRITRFLVVTTAVFLGFCGVRLSPRQASTPNIAYAAAAANVAVGPQYDSTHVYVAPQDVDRFVASLLATFGGGASKQAFPP